MSRKLKDRLRDPALRKSWRHTRESVDGLGVGGVLADVVPVELAEEVAAVPLCLVLRVLQHRRRHHGGHGGCGRAGPNSIENKIAQVLA